MRHASVTSAKMRSPLKETMRVNPSGGGRSKKKIVIALVLTSLVDAFSIMLLYLLVNNTGNGSTVELNRAEKLPMAVKNEALVHGTLVRIEGSRYFLGDNLIDKNLLPQALQKIKFQSPNGADSDSLIIQADKGIDFAMLAPVIRAGSVTGFHKFKFAVLQEESSL
jgi:biopolymer transport protein ExbD